MIITKTRFWDMVWSDRLVEIIAEVIQFWIVISVIAAPLVAIVVVLFVILQRTNKD